MLAYTDTGTENEKVKQKQTKGFYWRKGNEIELLKKKPNYHFKIANQLIMKNSNCILLKKIN